MAKKPAKQVAEPASTEFKILFTTTSAAKETTEVGTAGTDEYQQVHTQVNGRPSPPTIVTFQTRQNADLAFNQIDKFNLAAKDVAVHAVKLYA